MRIRQVKIRAMMLTIAVVALVMAIAISGSRLYRLAKLNQAKADAIAWDESFARESMESFAARAIKQEQLAASVKRGDLIQSTAKRDQRRNDEIRRILERYDRDQDSFPYALDKKNQQLARVASPHSRLAQEFWKLSREASKSAEDLGRRRRKFERAAKYPWLKSE